MANQPIPVPSVTQENEMASPQESVNWLIPIALFSCVLLAFFDKISIAALFSDEQFQKALGIDFDPTRLDRKSVV